MKAIQFSEAGSAKDVLSLVDIDPIAPGPGEVRVRITHSAVNPTDVKRRSTGRELGAFSPITPNNDGAGVIEAVGADVDPARVGQRVWIFGAQAGRPMGTAAEFCTIDDWMAPTLPDSATLEEGACLGVPAVTAYYSIFSDGPVDGKWVMVSGASGRVGSYAVQMAKLGGAKVIATAGNDENMAYAKSLGADHVLSHRDDNLAQQVLDLTDGNGVESLSEVEFGANVALIPEIVAPAGVVTSYNSDITPEPTLPFNQIMFKSITLRPYSIYALPEPTKREAFEAVNAMLETSQLKHRIAHRFPFDLDGVIEAHETIERKASPGVCMIVLSDE